MVYGAFLLSPVTWIFGPLKAWMLLPLLAIPLAAPVVRTVRSRTDGPSLNEALASSGRLELDLLRAAERRRAAELTAACGSRSLPGACACGRR